MSDRLVPRATYRLQLHQGFRFGDAGRLAPYLESLGVSHVYLSPILMARAGSTHGYDTVDHTRINPELGTLDEFRDMAAALRGHGLGIILDIVPNHMGIGGADNPYWLDVLENGQGSRLRRVVRHQLASGRTEPRRAASRALPRSLLRRGAGG